MVKNRIVSECEIGTEQMLLKYSPQKLLIKDLDHNYHYISLAEAVQSYLSLLSTIMKVFAARVPLVFKVNVLHVSGRVGLR